METQHKVFPVGAGRDALAIHVWVSVAGVQIEIHGRIPLPCPVIRMAVHTPEWWRGTAAICRGVGTAQQRQATLGIAQGKTADLVEWSIGLICKNITVTLPRDTWIAICEWVAAGLQEEKE